MPEPRQTDVLNKWRLILGKNARNHIDFLGTEQQQGLYENMENTLDFLYQREYGEDIMREDQRSGSIIRNPAIKHQAIYSLRASM